MPRCVENDLKSIFSTSLRVIGDVGISSSADDDCGTTVNGDVAFVLGGTSGLPGLKGETLSQWEKIREETLAL